MRSDGGLTIVIEATGFTIQAHTVGWRVLKDMLRPAICDHSIVYNKTKLSNLCALPKDRGKLGGRDGSVEV